MASCPTTLPRYTVFFCLQDCSPNLSAQLSQSRTGLGTLWDGEKGSGHRQRAPVQVVRSPGLLGIYSRESLKGLQQPPRSGYREKSDGQNLCSQLPGRKGVRRTDSFFDKDSPRANVKDAGGTALPSTSPGSREGGRQANGVHVNECPLHVSITHTTVHLPRATCKT